VGASREKAAVAGPGVFMEGRRPAQARVPRVGAGATCAAEEKGRSSGRAAGESEGVEENERG